MPTTMSSREFNQDTSGAKKAAHGGPVFITDRGKTAHVLMTMEHYQSLLAHRVSLVESLSMPADCDIEFEPVRARFVARPVDLD